MNASLKEQLYIIHGMRVTIISDDALARLISEYFQTFYRGDALSRFPSLEFEFHITDAPPPLPPGSTKAMQGPYVTHYRNNENVYSLLDDGSCIRFNSLTKKAEGFLKSTLLDKTFYLYALIGSSLLEALKYYGLYPFHAAALQGNGISCLVSGDGGCGKTTTTLGLVREGFKYVSDDSLFLRESREGVVVSPLYTYVNVDQDLADRFPEILDNRNVKIPAGMKESVNLANSYPHASIPSLRPDVIIFPKIVPCGESVLEPISQMEMYSLLLQQTILPVDDKIGRKHLNIIEMLVKQTKGYTLHSGQDIHADPGIFISLITEKITAHGYC